jgi:hypothetical protein
MYKYECVKKDVTISSLKIKLYFFNYRTVSTLRYNFLKIPFIFYELVKLSLIQNKSLKIMIYMNKKSLYSISMA